MAAKKVSKRYALNEFKTTGLVLILYSMFVLYIPLVLNKLFELYDLTYFNDINLLFLTKTFLMIIGTILPFMLLRLSSRKQIKTQNKIETSFKDILGQAIVFFTLTSIALFVMTAIANTFSYSGKLVSGIGISISSEYMGDLIYAITFIVISPILEEYAFRGVLLNVLSKYGKHFALYASALIFALAHGYFLEFIPSFVMGLLLGKIALRYKSIKPTIWIHILFNGVLYVLFLVPEKYSMVSAVILLLIYLAAIVLWITNNYRNIVVKRAKNSATVMKMFITTGPILVAMFLLIINSILTSLIG